MAGVTFCQSCADHLVMVHLQHSALISVIQCTLEVFGDLLLPELFLNTIDDGHDTVDVFVEDVAFL